MSSYNLRQIDRELWMRIKGHAKLESVTETHLVERILRAWLDVPDMDQMIDKDAHESLRFDDNKE